MSALSDYTLSDLQDARDSGHVADADYLAESERRHPSPTLAPGEPTPGELDAYESAQTDAGDPAGTDATTSNGIADLVE